MGNAAKLNDIGTEHDGFHPTPIIAASPIVTIDGKPAARTDDPVDCGGVLIGGGTVNIG
jgi:uncharacterized Zn-binding protein involved in type VI secretion